MHGRIGALLVLALPALASGSVVGGELALRMGERPDDVTVASLTRPLAAGFTAPGAADAVEAWTTAGSAPVVQVVRGRVRTVGVGREVAVALHRTGEETWLEVLFAQGEVPSGLSGVVELEDRGRHWVVRTRHRDFVLSPSWVGPEGTPTEAHWSEWVYTTLLLGFEGPAYAPYADDTWRPATEAERTAADDVVQADAEGLEQAVDELLSTALPPSDDGWEDAIEHVTALDRPDLAMALYRRYRPVGRCSMDRKPASVAGQYRDLCFSEGRTGCALQLHVRVMADGFDRIAWSTYGEAAQDTQVDVLERMGVDVPRFLTGLLLGYDDVPERPVGISMQRLGRAVHESSRRDELLALLEGLARDEALDPYNRFRATVAAWHARRYDLDDLSPAGLHPLAVAWLSTVPSQ